MRRFAKPFGCRFKGSRVLSTEVPVGNQTLTKQTATPPPPPPSVVAAGRKLPPPPPLPSKIPEGIGVVTGRGELKTPQEVLNMLIDYIPTFFVPTSAVASILDEETRDFVQSKGKWVYFLKRFRFQFDMRSPDGVRWEVKLRDDVHHPRRGIADAKFQKAELGEFVTYSVRPEFVKSLKPIDNTLDVNTRVVPDLPPPAVHMKLEDKVPVLERLKAIVGTDYQEIEELEERIPEDVLLHPYFDCQGGMASISVKFPDSFQLVGTTVRVKPPHLAPLALDDFTFDKSPYPDIIQRVKDVVTIHDVPLWISITSIYEQLSLEQRRKVKRAYKSFVSFLRAHGAALAVSNDLLKVSHWIPPKHEALAPGANADGSVNYTPTFVLNDLFDRFPKNRTLTKTQLLKLVPEHLRPSLPADPIKWISSHKNYFTVEGLKDGAKDEEIFIRRSTDYAALDVALAMYPHIPDDGIASVSLLKELPTKTRLYIQKTGLQSVCENLEDWLELLDGDVFRKRTMDELERTLQKSKGTDRLSDD